MELENKVNEIIKNLNVDLNDLNNNDLNLLTNQTFNALYQINNNIEYCTVYSSVINVVNRINKKETDDEIKNKFHKFRHQLDLLDQVKQENFKNIETINDVQKQIIFEKVKHLKSLFQPEQRSPEWYKIRETLCTASADTYDIIMGNQKKVILKKCGLGTPFHGNKYTWHGNKYEDIAIGIYESRYNREVWEFGLIQHPTINCLGASPDGITTCGRMLEIKCPSGRKINGHIKPVYFCQMQTQMEVCDLDVCDFFEANIIQYRSYDEYKKDEYIEDIDDPDYIPYLDIIPMKLDNGFIKVPNDRRTSDGLEKGMIGSYGPHPGDMKHIFPPFHVSSREQYKWMMNKKEEFAKKDIELIIDYWYCQTTSLNIVKRDRKWWSDKKITEKLYDTWDKIYEARKTENGTDKYLSTKKYNEKYNIDQGTTVDLSNLFGDEDNNKQTNLLTNEIKLDECLLFSDDDFTINEPKPKKKIKKIKKKKIKKIKKVKKIKKKKVIKNAETSLDTEVIQMMSELCISDSD